jgi:hypothetical protein
MPISLDGGEHGLMPIDFSFGNVSRRFSDAPAPQFIAFEAHFLKPVIFHKADKVQSTRLTVCKLLIPYGVEPMTSRFCGAKV